MGSGRPTTNLPRDRNKRTRTWSLEFPWDKPLPTGREAAAEAMRLAQALVGESPDWIEGAFVSERARPRKVPLPVILHEIISRGPLIQDNWIELLPDGAARKHLKAPDVPGVPTIEVAVDANKTPATDRLRRLLSIVEPSAPAVYKRVITSALRVCDRHLSGATYADGCWRPAPDLFLSGVASVMRKYWGPSADLPRRMLMGRTDIAAAVPVGDTMPKPSKNLLELVDAARQAFATDWLSAGALILAAWIPWIRAKGLPAATRTSAYMDGFLLARELLLFGDPHSIRDLAKTFIGGDNSDVNALSELLLDQTHQHLEAAVNDSASFEDFGSMLARAAHYALATRLLCEYVQEQSPHPPPSAGAWERRSHTVEELYVRIRDGLIAQWRGMRNPDLWRERLRVKEASARGEKRKVWQLLNEGEFALRRPRNLRPWLLGEDFTGVGSSGVLFGPRSVPNG